MLKNNFNGCFENGWSVLVGLTESKALSPVSLVNVPFLGCKMSNGFGLVGFQGYMGLT